MIRSMTGYGRYEAQNEDARLITEIKSVNHRFCDISLRLPRNLNAYENDIRNQIKASDSRGKIDVYITYENNREGETLVAYNKAMAKSYMDLLARISEDFHIPNDTDAFTLSKYPDVYTLKEETVDEEKLYGLVQQTVAGALKDFIQSKETEGRHLKEDLLQKLDYLEMITKDIANRAPSVFDEYRERLRAKVDELLGDTKIDESVLATELVLYADKICVDEELVRLNSHIRHMRETLEEGSADADGSVVANGHSITVNVGKKLDFIAQELNREANTTLSKANDIILSNQGILLKTEIEKIREQIQNLE